MRNTGVSDWRPPSRNWKAYNITTVTLCALMLTVYAFTHYWNTNTSTKTPVNTLQLTRENINSITEMFTVFTSAEVLTTIGVDTTARNINPHGVSYNITSTNINNKTVAFGFIATINTKTVNAHHVRLIEKLNNTVYLNTDKYGAFTVLPLIHNFPVNTWVNSGNVFNNILRDPKIVLTGIIDGLIKKITQGTWCDANHTMFTVGILTITVPTTINPTVQVMNTATNSYVNITVNHQTPQKVTHATFFPPQKNTPHLTNMGNKIVVVDVKKTRT